MRATFPWLAWVGRESLVARFALPAIAVSTVIAATAFGASSVLFPKPLHLVRTIEDPLARNSATVHEYCAGNQVITVHGSRVAIADYAKQQLTEIDREAGTYSITPFQEIAQANTRIAGRTTTKAARTPSSQGAKQDAWTATQTGARSVAATGRSVDSWKIERTDARQKTTIDVGIDRRVPLSRDAVEVLLGASYPNPRREEHDALLRAASGPAEAQRRQPSANSVAAAQPGDYGLPVEQVLTFESEGERIEVRNTIREVKDDLPPPDLLIIPPGSKLVESHAVRMARELRELDELPAQAPRP